MRSARLALLVTSIGAGLWASEPRAFLSARQTYRPGRVDYDIVYVRQPRFGDSGATIWPEVVHPARIDPGADLMLLRPDGREELLFRGGDGSVTDPFVSFDGRAVYFSYFHDVRPASLNQQRANLPYRGADIFRITLADRRVTQLTHGEFTPNTGAGSWDEKNPLNPPATKNALGYGVLNLGPCPLPDGRIAFTSNRNGFDPPRNLTAPTLQLFVMDEDGGNVTAIAPMTIGSALHPTVLSDGRLMFSTYESQGVRDSRLWGIWTIQPDGRAWRPLVSAFKASSAFHFMTQLSNGHVVAEHYYNLNNNGFGAYLAVPPPVDGEPAFHSAVPAENPTFVSDVIWFFRMAFTPRGAYTLTPFTHGEDQAATLGKVTHPSAAPYNDLLTVWSKGPANNLNRPTDVPKYDGGLYLIRGGRPIAHPGEMLLIKNDPNYNEAWPRAVVPYAAIHGVAEPVALPWLPNDGRLHPLLPAGTPFGLVGASSVYKRESAPGHGPAAFGGLDAFNTAENDASSNWFWQGADAGRYDNADIWAIRILSMEPNTHRSYGPNAGAHFHNAANERLRILGEIPLRKWNGSAVVEDEEGHPDTSFLVKLPADTPFTFQTLDRDGLVLNMSQTWHQVRPGEVRTDCGGCHAHSQKPLAFAGTAAARPDHQVFDLSKVTPLVSHDPTGQPALTIEQVAAVDVEFYRDIRPILQRSCVSCHTRSAASPPGNLVLDDDAMYAIPNARDGQRAPGDFLRLAADQQARWGYRPLLQFGWRQTNLSRYVRPFQSRRSLLVWKIFGRRLDGWTNASHPTERVPGDATTLPPGTSANLADLDYTGSIMPPADAAVPRLSEAEKRLIARWVDLGVPIDTGFRTSNAGFGWFLDDLRPTLEVSAPRAGANTTPPNAIRIGVTDAYSGIRAGSLSVTADFVVQGLAPGAELASLARPVADGVYEIPIVPSTTLRGTVSVSVSDNQGNVTRVRRSFWTR
jgi:hypothetical protein